MRQGPVYAMSAGKDIDRLLHIPVPLELVEDFENVEFINWIDRNKGQFSLILVYKDNKNTGENIVSEA